MDDVLKDRILKKEYEPEQKRWIAQRVEGKFKDWFSRISEIEAEK